MNDTTNCPGQKCLDNGLPVEVHAAMATVLETMRQFTIPPAPPEAMWSMLDIFSSAIPEEVLSDSHLFKFGVQKDVHPLFAYFFPSEFSNEEFARLIGAPEPNSFFKPLDTFDVTSMIGMAYVSHGGATDTHLDASITLAAGTLTLVSQLENRVGMWHGYDMPGGRYALAVEINGRRWLFVVHFREIRNMTPSRKLQ